MLRELPTDVHEVIVVDGHSSDGTQDIVRDLGFRLETQEGRGYGMAVRTGIKLATGDVITCMDADGSYDPEALGRLMAGIRDGNDGVFCSRYLPDSGSDDDTPIRYLGNMIFTIMLRLLHGVRLSDSLFYYALIRREVLQSLPLTSEDFSMCIEIPILMHRMGYRYAEIPSRERKRLAGVSKVNALTDGTLILKSMLRFKFMPQPTARRVAAE
jgi:glycosyltransferase involved in cell wall biosynthesis